MERDLNKFLENYNISKIDFDSSKLDWDELLEIADDYDKFKLNLEEPAKSIVKEFSDPILKDVVHSLIYRIKETDSLIHKIIRDKPKRNIETVTVSNYKDQVKDLIGIRVFHLLKDDFYGIHEKIKLWEFNEVPEINYRKGDDIYLFKEGFNPIEREDYYRSVHYVIEYKFDKETYIAEIQVRTLSEEIWSGISHKLNYPIKNNNSLIIKELNIINRICGTVDEMCANIFGLNENIKNLQSTISENSKN